jgi:hypothetical protein
VPQPFLQNKPTGRLRRKEFREARKLTGKGWLDNLRSARRDFLGTRKLKDKLRGREDVRKEVKWTKEPLQGF